MKINRIPPESHGLRAEMLRAAEVEAPFEGKEIGTLNTLDATTTFQMVRAGLPNHACRVTLSFDPADPHALTARFHTAGNDETVDWTCARSTMAEGQIQAAGEGDIKVWPSTSDGAPVVALSLSSPSGGAMFEIPAGDLALFIEATNESVAPGTEEIIVRQQLTDEKLQQAFGASDN